MTITFDGETLTNAKTISESRVDNGGIIIVMRGYTETLADITTLDAKRGVAGRRRLLDVRNAITIRGAAVKGTLVRNGAANLTNCVISDLKVTPRPDYKAWDYTITFWRDTT